MLRFKMFAGPGAEVEGAVNQWLIEYEPEITQMAQTADGDSVVISFVFDHVFAPIPDPGWAAFAYSVSFTTVCFVPTWLLYRRGTFLKV